MTYVIGEQCLDVKDASCLDVCPVDCIHEAEDMFVIDPRVCIDCAACVWECPVEAIYLAEDLPKEQRDFQARNLEAVLDLGIEVG